MKHALGYLCIAIFFCSSIISSFSQATPVMRGRSFSQVQFFLPLAQYGDGLFWSAVGDLNNDNLTQEVVWMNSTYAIAFNSSGIPLWQTTLQFSITMPCLGDFDRDGYTDDLYNFESHNAYNSSGHYIPQNQNTSKPLHYANFTSYCLMGAVGDLNHDGYADDIVLPRKAFAYGKPSAPYWNFSKGSNYYGIQIGDLDNKGYFDDSLIATDNGTYALNETGKILWWIPYASYDAGDPPMQTMIINDFDGDGYKSDVLLTTGSSLFAFNESGKVLWNFSYNPYQTLLALGDLDDDGVKDAVAFMRTSQGANKADLMMLDLNTHTLLWNYTLPLSWTLTFADLEGNGFQDSVIVGAGKCYAFNKLGQLLGAGGKGNNMGFYCGDFDGNGRQDDFLSATWDGLESYRFAKLQIQIALLPEVTQWSEGWVTFKLNVTSQETIPLEVAWNLTGALAVSRTGKERVVPGAQSFDLDTQMAPGTCNITVTLSYVGLPFAETQLVVTINPPIGSPPLWWSAVLIALMVVWYFRKGGRVKQIMWRL